MLPACLQGLSLATILLAAAGNALMVPRALWTRDWIWLTGSLWGSLFFGWAQLLRCAVRGWGQPAWAGAQCASWDGSGGLPQQQAGAPCGAHHPARLHVRTARKPPSRCHLWRA